MNKETYGFKSKHHHGILKELETFGKDLLNMTSSLKSRNTTKDLQFKGDVCSIKLSSDVLIFAVRTSNIYKASPEQYKKS